MKRLYNLVSVSAVVLSFAACGDDDNAGGAGGAGSAGASGATGGVGATSSGGTAGAGGTAGTAASTGSGGSAGSEQCDPLGADIGGATAVATFHSMGLYWTPSGSAANKDVAVRFREVGRCTWREGLPMKHQPINGTNADLDADYRGSLVNLKPGTSYEVELTLEGTSETSIVTLATWSETFPEGEVTKVSSQNTTLNVTTSGTKTAYRVIDGTGAKIDVNDKAPQAITIDASYVIIRGFKLAGGSRYGIRITGGHDIIIEDCDITNWGDVGGTQGFGESNRGAITSTEESLERVIVQRTKMHHPRTDSNSWSEPWDDDPGSTHPKGAQCIAFLNSRGNHVLRYNECYSDVDHMFCDGFGFGGNFDDYGFPGPDSDIYGNYVANTWDDGLEIEGGGRNVRVWNNYVEEAFIPYANAAVTIGPLYLFRNVSGRSAQAPTGNGYGYWLKSGFALDEKFMRGYTYILHNTVTQPNGKGAGGIGSSGANRVLKHVVSRNNVLHVRSSTTNCLADNNGNTNVDGDYDLCNATFPGFYGSNGISGTPQYATSSGFSFATMTGDFELASSSPGYQAGEPLPNFSEGYSGAAPDVGAHQSGWAPIKYGVGATFSPP